jgi:hypothetical protein
MRWRRLGFKPTAATGWPLGSGLTTIIGQGMSGVKHNFYFFY